MRIALTQIVFTVVLATIGCQSNSENQQSLNESNSDQSSSETTVAEPLPPNQPESTELVSSPDANLAADSDSMHSESEDHEHGPGMGHGPAGGMGRGPGGMGGMREDMETLHAMFADRDKIKRTVKNLDDGAEALTESDDEAIASLLQEHVPAMEHRVLENKPLPPMTFHPIFVELIKHSDDYTLTYEATDKGMKATYQSDDPYVVMLVQEHAKLVSRFIKNGMSEVHAEYTLPELETP